MPRLRDDDGGGRGDGVTGNILGEVYSGEKKLKLSEEVMANEL